MRLTVMGEPVMQLSDESFAVSFSGPLTRQMADLIKRKWSERMGDKRLIVLDGGNRGPEPTPIYDALVAELGSPLGETAVA